jgi:bifunctional DNA-binding transcriptional regulator/antitoxin component of YhaV-PrlF toxin-antitoxin module
MDRLVSGLATKSAKIRALAAAGVKRSDIARYFGIRYQHVRNVLVYPLSRRSAPSQAGYEEGPRPDESVRITVGPSGRIVIPAAMRAKMGADEGKDLIAHLEDGELRLATPAVLMRRAQKLVRDAIPPTVKLADELIAERRHEAAREED